MLMSLAPSILPEIILIASFGLYVVATRRPAPVPEVPNSVPDRKEPTLPVPETESERRAELRLATRPKLVVSQQRAGEILIEHLNCYGVTGYVTATELDDYWLWAQAERDIQPMSPMHVRGALAKSCLGQRRIMGPEFGILRQRLEANYGTLPGRPVLYAIPKIRVKPASEPEQPDTGRDSHGCAGPQPVTLPGRVPVAIHTQSHGRAVA